MTRPLKFLLVTTFYPPYSFGGDAVFVARLAHALAADGHRVDVVHCLDSYHALHPQAEEREPAFESHPNLTVHGLRSGFGILAPLLSHQTGRASLTRNRIREIIKGSAPDVIHYHNVSLFGPEVLALGSAATETLKLYTTHEYWLICSTHVLWKFNSRPCEKPECIRCMLIARRPPQLWRYTGMLERYTAQVDTFISPSRFAAEMHARRGFSRPMIHLPTFADAGVEAPSARPYPRPYFLFVGRLEPGKNAGSLIAVWSKNSEADLLIAGDGSEAEKLRVMAAGNPRVRFLGFTTQAALGPLYEHSIAIIVPSLMYEVFTTVVLEAFAHKAPVIVRDQGPLREMVEDSGGGLLYRTEEELLEAVARLARDPSTRNELGIRGYQMTTGKWSQAAHMSGYFDVIRESVLRKFGHLPWEG